MKHMRSILCRVAATKTDRSAGFTLVELLVVVAIMAVLLAILLPSLKKARDLAKTAICVNNQHQIGLAMGTYAMDNSGYLPRGVGPPAAGCRQGWVGLLASYVYQTDNWDDSKLTYNPGSLKIFLCPSVELVQAPASIQGGQTIVGYYKRISSSYAAIKPFVGSGIQTGPAPPYNDKAHSQLIGNIGKPASKTVTCGYSADHTFSYGTYNLGNSKLAVIHQGRVSVLYLDFHAAAENETYLYLNRRLLTTINENIF